MRLRRETGDFTIRINLNESTDPASRTIQKDLTGSDFIGLIVELGHSLDGGSWRTVHYASCIGASANEDGTTGEVTSWSLMFETDAGPFRLQYTPEDGVYEIVE